MLFIILLISLLVYCFTKEKIFYWIFILCLAVYGFIIGMYIGMIDSLSDIINNLL